MDEDVKDLIESTAAETRRYFDVVAGRLEQRFDGLEGRFDGLEGRFDGLEGRFDGLEGRFDGLEGRFEGLENRFDRLETSAAETRRHFDVIAERLEAKIELVAEGVVGCNERIDRLAADTSAEFDDVRALIKISYTALDSRLQVVEKILIG